jgi:IS605 OrfB family transposase
MPTRKKESTDKQKPKVAYRSVSLGLIGEGHPSFKGCWQLCYYSARLYNVGLHNLRQQWIEYQYFLSKPENFHWVKCNPNYQALMSDQAQQTLSVLYRDMSSFFAARKAARESGSQRRVNLPRYKPNEAKQGLTLNITYGRSLRGTKKTDKGFVLEKRETLIPFSRNFKDSHPEMGEGIPLTLPKALVDKVINEVKIVPRHVYGKQRFEIHVTYGFDVRELRREKGRYLSVDLGLKNFAACFDSDGENFLLKDKGLLAFNKRFNDVQDTLKHRVDTLENRLKTDTFKHDEAIVNVQEALRNTRTKQHTLSKQRQHKMQDWMNRSALVIARYALDNNIKTVVVGHNKNQKQHINIGRNNNRRFVEIPFGEFRDRLRSRLEEIGVAFETQEESYTSKCSFLDKEYPGKKKTGEYLGKRAYRGLFKTHEGKRVNADIQAAANILVKYLNRQGVLEVWYDHHFEKARQGIVNFPHCVNPQTFTQKHKLSFNTVWPERKKSHVL